MYCNILYLILLCNLYWLNINAETQTTEDRKDYILNGEQVTTHEYPFMVSLQEIDADGTRSRFCGGVILSPLWILTAAHCYEEEVTPSPSKDFGVNAGILNAFDYDSPSSQYIQVERIEKHPRYNIQTLENDIALLKLTKPFVYTAYVKSIQLPPRDYQAKEVGTILGWGAVGHEENVDPDYLRFASINVSRIQDCQQFYPTKLSEKLHICLGLGSRTKACGGDSGGPFLQIYNGEMIVVGITSYGRQRECSEHIPVIYTNVATYLDWIEMTMG